MAERQIEREWVERTIREPETIAPDPNHPDRIRAFPAVPERDGRVLRVVYVPQQGGYRVVTAFLDRGRKRQQ